MDQNDLLTLCNLITFKDDLHIYDKHIYISTITNLLPPKLFETKFTPACAGQGKR